MTATQGFTFSFWKGGVENQRKSADTTFGIVGSEVSGSTTALSGLSEFISGAEYEGIGVDLYGQDLVVDRRGLYETTVSPGSSATIPIHIFNEPTLNRQAGYDITVELIQNDAPELMYLTPLVGMTSGSNTQTVSGSFTDSITGDVSFSIDFDPNIFLDDYSERTQFIPTEVDGETVYVRETVRNEVCAENKKRESYFSILTGGFEKKIVYDWYYFSNTRNDFVRVTNDTILQKLGGNDRSAEEGIFVTRVKNINGVEFKQVPRFVTRYITEQYDDYCNYKYKTVANKITYEAQRPSPYQHFITRPLSITDNDVKFVIRLKATKKGEKDSEGSGDFYESIYFIDIIINILGLIDVEYTII